MPTWLAAAQAAASARNPTWGLSATPHTESASGSGPFVPAWLRAARAAAGFAAPSGASTPSVPTRHDQVIHSDLAMAARQRLRADGARPPTVIQRLPPPRAAANEPPRTAAATIAEVRRVAQQRLMLLPRLHTKTAQRRAADLGELISFSSQRENQCELAGLKWLDVAPQYAIEGRLGDTITNLGSIATVDRMLTAAKSFNGHKHFTESIQEWVRLMAHMRNRGGPAAARANEGRANANDVCMFLENRRDDSYEQYAQGGRAPPASAALSATARPQKRTRTGASTAPSARKRLKHMRDEWRVDVEVDDRVRVRARPLHGQGAVSEKAPAPPLFMMKGLQGLAADSRANPYARMIARALCLLAFGGFREEQTHLFGVLAISTHNGRATMYCKTKRKARDAPTEYGIVPLSGITDDDGAWMQGGENLMATLPGDADFFLPGFDAPAGKRANDPYAAFRVLPAPMSQKQMDESIAHVLHRSLGYEWNDARLFTRHSFKHFLPEIIQEAPLHCEHAALEQCNDAMRWAGSVLSDNPGLLAGADKHRDKYISSISNMPRNYSEGAQVKRLRLLAQHHLDRAHRAIMKAGGALPRFGGFELLEP